MLESPSSNNLAQTPKFKQPSSNNQSQTTKLEHPISNNKTQTTKLKHPMFGFDGWSLGVRAWLFEIDCSSLVF
jgi:hypothetical protein